MNTRGFTDMKFGVTYKLFLSLLTAAGLAVVCSALIMQWKINHGFLKYINSVEKTGLSRLATTLEERYRTEQSWIFLTTNPGRWRQLVFTSFPAERFPPPPPQAMPHSGPPPPSPDGTMHDHGPLPPPIQHFVQRLYLLDAEGKIILSQAKVGDTSTATPLHFRNSVVGYLGLVPRTRSTSDEPQKRFIKEQEQSLALTAVVVVILAAALSLLMARRLVRPLRELAGATHRLAAGEFSVRVPIGSGDELGQLAGDFNSLALTLEKNEESRRQWVADISHELRTPLAILRGEIEALQDGIRTSTPQTIQSLHGEVLHLGRLVDDLYQLSMSDVGALTYRKQELDLGRLLNDIQESFIPEFSAKGIRVERRGVQTSNTTVFGDPERLRQLFTNLLDNSLKYTDSGGMLLIRVQGEKKCVVVDFQDSAPAVPPEEISRLFERLYRVDSSRNRSTGGAGLGLAICRNIVEAHGGTITAQRADIGGLWIRIEFPWKGTA